MFASAERRADLDDEFQLRTAEQVAERLGEMKGALMKLGQMASYLDDGLPEPVRQALATLQADAPPMSPELAAEVVERELGRPPDAALRRVGPDTDRRRRRSARSTGPSPDPVTGTGVAVKVQYPGVDDAIGADLANADLLGTFLRQGFAGSTRPRSSTRSGAASSRSSTTGSRRGTRPPSPTATAAIRSSTCPTWSRRCRPPGC